MERDYNHKHDDVM